MLDTNCKKAAVMEASAWSENDQTIPNRSRNKTETIARVIEATKIIILRDGISGLKINKIQRESGRSKGMIYEYFGNIQGLIRATIQQSDPWLMYKDNLHEILKTHKDNFGRDLPATLLKDHFANYIKDPMSQAINLLELTKKDDEVLRELSELRERIAENVFSISDSHFSNSSISIRMITALLAAGINYMVLHKQSNGSTFCGMDIEKSSDRIILDQTIDQIISWAYERVEQEMTDGKGANYE